MTYYLWSTDGTGAQHQAIRGSAIATLFLLCSFSSAAAVEQGERQRESQGICVGHRLYAQSGRLADAGCSNSCTAVDNLHRLLHLRRTAKVEAYEHLLSCMYLIRNVT